MHLTQREMLAFGDFESLGGPIVDAAALRHVAECAECRTALERARVDRAVVAGALELLDHPLVPATAEVVVARALERERGRRRRRTAAVTGSLLFAGAVAAAAMPGSPWHSALVRRLEHPAARVAVRPSLAAAAIGTAQRPETAEAGIAFVPHDRVELVFEAPDSRGYVRLVFAQGESVRVTHQGGGAAYISRDRSITVDNRGSSADFSVVLPRTLAAVTIRSGGRVVFAKSGNVIRAAAGPDSTGTYVISLGAANAPAKE